MAPCDLEIEEFLRDLSDFEENNDKLSKSNLVQQIFDITKFIDVNKKFLNNFVGNIKIFLYI